MVIQYKKFLFFESRVHNVRLSNPINFFDQKNHEFRKVLKISAKTYSGLPNKG